MTDIQVPRGGAVAGPLNLPAVAWYEFILNDQLLEEHLNKSNPDPTPVQLITQFMQQADIEVTNTALNKEHQQRAGQTLGAPVPQPTDPDVKTGDQDQNAEDTKKVLALKLMAMKVASHLRWNISILEKGVPLPVSQSLLVELLKLMMGDSMGDAKKKDLNFEGLSNEAAFAVHLYHRWCVQSVIKDSFPCRPVKQVFFPVPGQIDPVMAMAAATEAICKGLKEELECSIAILEKCIQFRRKLCMPTIPCFVVPNEQSEAQYEWEKGIIVPLDEVTCQVSYDLGTVYFHQCEYKKAYEMFNRAKDILEKLSSPVYCFIDDSRLRGYLTSCRSLLGVAVETSKSSLIDRAEASRRQNYHGLVEILIEDNLRQELSTVYRGNLEDEIGGKGKSFSSLYNEILMCNGVRSVMEGKALVSPILDVLEKGEQQLIQFVVRILSDVMKGASHAQRSNLRCFIWHLVELASPECGFSHAVLRSELASYFSEDECTDLALGEDGDEMYLDDFEMDDSSTATSYPSSRESSYDVGEIESRLLTVYDPDMIRDLVRELCQSRNWKLAQFMNLNDKWKIPREIRQIVESLSRVSVQQAYIFVLVGKARHCMDIRIFERARQLLSMVDVVVADLSYVMSKQVRWQILLADLLQFYLNETFGEGSTMQDLVKKTKTCLTTVRLGQDIQPSDEVLEHCTAFLLNIRDWDYLSNLENTANGYIEVSRLLACCCKELGTVRNARKPARDVWDAVLQIFLMNTQHKRSSNGRDSAMHRDSQLGILSREAFVSFLEKIKEPTVLTLMISLFTKLFTILKDDITSEISSDFLSLWPTAISNAGAMNVQAVEDGLTVLMQHCLKVNPTRPPWLRTQADIFFAHSQYSTAMKFYLEAGVVATDFFTTAVSKSVYDDQVYRRMIKCCSYLQCHTQVALLCQFLEEIDYATAFKALQERTSYDAMDAYYSCIWDVSTLEYLAFLIDVIFLLAA